MFLILHPCFGGEDGGKGIRPGKFDDSKIVDIILYEHLCGISFWRLLFYHLEI